MKPDIIILYLIHTGALTVPEGKNIFPDLVQFRRDADENDENETFTIIHWDFRDGNGVLVPQPDLEAIAATGAYQTYEANRPSIEEKKANEKRFDTDKLELAVYDVIREEINRGRKFERDLLAAVAAASTLANLKSGIAAIVTQNADISLADAKQLVKNKL